MKILEISKYYPPEGGGIEVHLKLLVEELSKNNEVTVICSNTSFHKEVQIEENLKIVKSRYLFSVANNPFFIPPKEIFQEYDIIHVHSPYPYGEVLGYKLSKCTGKPLIITYHSDILKKGIFKSIYNPVQLKVLNHSRRIMPTSSKYVEGSEILRRFRDKITIIPCGVDIEKFSRGNPEAVRSRYGLKGNVLLFVGRLVPYKGLEYLIKACKILRNDFKLLIVGSGPLEVKLKRMVRRMNLTGKIIFCGRVSDDELPDYYHAADIFILPSTYKAEAFGLVQIEAMAAGLPVISTDIPGSGVPFVNVDGETGFVVPIKNSRALAEKIELLLRDEKLRKKLGENGKKRARLFTYQENARKTEQVMKEVISETS
ncbi:MAG: glycosyl transferase family 1 [Candidatus Aenigmatarchaeota archaeon]|nr:MAG: glycosyl transferase family 1 [Candidatus Aenigmarchaeota archaeon]